MKPLSGSAFCALMIAAFVRPAGLQSLLLDGDTGWHIRTGESILSTRVLPHTDLYSFTRSGHPWFAWEWGSDALTPPWCRRSRS